MTSEQFKQVQEQYRQEPVLFFIEIGTVNNTGDTIATEYTRDEMVRDCIAAIPLSQFAFEWNDGGFEAVPEISNSWVAVSPNADAKGGGSYNEAYDERVQEIVNKQ